MPVRIRRTRRGGLRLTARFPVNAASRAHVDAEIGRIRGCVIPVIVDRGGRPSLEASAVALRWRDRHCLATALHVLTSNEGRLLLVFGADGVPRHFAGPFSVSPDADLAVTCLDEEDAAGLAHVPFLDASRIGAPETRDGTFYASVVGFPHTASRLVDRVTIETPMEVFSDKGWIAEDGGLEVAFDKRQGAFGGDGHVLPRDPRGKSGGAIFGLPRMGLNAVWPGAEARLVGIATEWRGKRILGAGPSVLTRLLDEAVARAGTLDQP